jgi:hypothetical protein
MSNGSAIAATTAVLQRLFQAALPAASLSNALGGAPTVTALPPDRITVGDDEAPGLNLFLYRVTPNLGWQNAELPSHGSDGTRRTAAPVAVDLHYVISAYGKQDLHAEVLLGHALLLLHGTRHLTRAAIRDTFAGGGGGGLSAAEAALLGGSGLDGQEEVIRLAPEQLTIDDISKLWSVFGERYRLTLAFNASVIVLRPDEAGAQNPPVREPQLQVIPLAAPRIDAVTPTAAEVGGQVVLRGHGLLTPNTVLRFAGLVDVNPAAGSTPTRVEAAVPAGARAGLTGVQVIHSVDFGASGLRAAADSNIGAFVLRPAFEVDGQGDPLIDAVNTTVANGVVTQGVLEVTLTPQVGREQKVRLLLDQTGGGALHYALTAPSRAAAQAETTAVIEVPVAGIEAGTYLVSVEVDGAATALVTDNTGLYVGPAVTF